METIDSQINKLFASLLNEARVESETSKERITFLLENLQEVIQHHGINKDQLSRLINIIISTDEGLTVSEKSFIVRKLLVTRNRVSESILLRIFGSFGHGKSFPDIRLQQLLTKWLVCVSGLLPSKTMKQLNGVMFNLLSLSYLIPWLSHLILLFTTKKHLKPWKIKIIYKLMKKSMVSSEYLLGLLKYFQEFVPNIEEYDEEDRDEGLIQVMEQVPEMKVGKKLFKYPDYKFLETLGTVLEKQNEELFKKFKVKITDQLLIFQEMFNYNNHHKRAKIEYHQSFKITQSVRYLDHYDDWKSKEIFWNNISNNHNLLKNIEFLEVPNQLPEVFKLSYYQILMIILINDDYRDLDQYLKLSDFQDKSLINGCYYYSLMTGEIFPSILEKFVSDTCDNKNYWKFFKFLKINKFTKIFPKFKLKFIKNCNISWDCDFLLNLTRLIESWLFGATDEDFLTIIDIYDQMTPIILSKINKFLNHQEFLKLCHISFQFVSLIQLLPLDNPQYFKIMPIFLSYRFLFSNDGNSINYLCNYILYLKNYPLGKTEYLQESLEIRNSLILDVCNLIWRNKPFLKSSNTKGCLIDNVSVDDDWFDLSNFNTAFAGYYREIFNNRVNANDKLIHIDKKSYDEIKGLKEDNYEDFRVEILKNFRDIGFDQLTELLFTSLKTLFNKLS